MGFSLHGSLAEFLEGGGGAPSLERSVKKKNLKETLLRWGVHNRVGVN